LDNWLPQGQIDQKRVDALAMLHRMREHLASNPKRKRVTYKLEHTVFWEDLMLQAGGAEAQVAGEPTMVTTDEVLDELRLRGLGYLDAREQGLLRDLALHEAQRKGYHSDREMVQKKGAELRQSHSLQLAEDFDQWLQQNAISRHTFDDLIAEETLIARVLEEQDPRCRRMQDHLRVRGTYRQLRARALDKRQRLEQAGWQNPTLEDVGLTRESLCQWYFRRQGPFLPPDPEHYALTFGFKHVEAFLLTVLREFCYLRLKEAGTQEEKLRSSEAMA
jgi:hypothetical protein